MNEDIVILDVLSNKFLLARKFNKETGDIIGLPDKLGGVFIAARTASLNPTYAKAVMGIGHMDCFGEIPHLDSLLYQLKSLFPSHILFYATENLKERIKIVNSICESNPGIEYLYPI